MKKNKSEKIIRGSMIGLAAAAAISIGVAYQKNGFDSDGLNKNLYDFMKNEVVFDKQEKSVKDDESDQDNDFMKNQERNAGTDEKNEKQTSPLQKNETLANVDDEVLQQIAENANESVNPDNPSLTVLPTTPDAQTNTDSNNTGREMGVITNPSASDASNSGNTPAIVVPGGDSGDPSVTPGQGNQPGIINPSNPGTSNVEIKMPTYDTHPMAQNSPADSNNAFSNVGKQGANLNQDLEITEVSVFEIDDQDRVLVPKFLKGKELKEKDVIYGLDIQVRMSNDDIYRITDENDNNLQQIEFEETDDGSRLEVKVKVRLDEQSEWIESNTYEVELYDTRLIFVTSDGTVLFDRYMNLGDSLDVDNEDENNLFDEKNGLIKRKSIGEDPTLERVFTGFSLTPNGEPLKGNIEAQEGEHIIYVRDPLILDEDSPIHVSAKYGYINLGTVDEKYQFDQVLDDYRESDTELDVPYGITAIKNIHAKKIKLSSSVRTVDMQKGISEEGYELAEDNDNFVINDDGLLMNTDETELYGVPAALKTVEIPETIRKITCSFEQDQIVYFSGDYVPEFDFNTYMKDKGKDGMAKFVVQDEQYRDYISKWQVDEEYTSVIETEETFAENTFYNEEGALVQRLGDHSFKLNRIPDKTAPFYIVGDDVVEIGKNIFENNNTIATLIVPKGVKKIDATALDLNNVVEVYFLATDELPEIVNTSAFEGRLADLHVRSELQDEFEKYIKEQFKGHITNQKIEIDNDADNVIHEDDEGGTYYCFYGEGMLLQAPKYAETFTSENIPFSSKLQSLTNIVSEAFINRKNLRYVELPETVDMIGSSAFAGCENLEGVFLRREDDITIGEDAFDGCDSLRFVATNARNLEFSGIENMFQNHHKYVDEQLGEEGEFGHVFVNYYGGEADEYIYTTPIADHMFTRQYGKGYILYAELGSEEDGGIYRYVLSATSGISGEIEFPEDTYHINDSAFEDISSEFWISESSWENIIAIGERAFKFATKFTGIGEHTLKLRLNDDTELLGEQAFYGCSGIEHVQVEMEEEELYDSYYARIENQLTKYIFSHCTNLKDITFTEQSKVKVMETDALLHTQIETLTLPPTITAVSEHAFPETLKVLNITGETPFEIIFQGEEGGRFYFKNNTEQMTYNNDFIILFDGQPATENPELVEKYIDMWRFSWRSYDTLDQVVNHVYEDMRKLYVGDMKKSKVKQQVIDIMFASENEILHLFGFPSISMEEYEEKYVEELEDIDIIIDTIIENNGLKGGDDPGFPDIPWELDDPWLLDDPDDPTVMDSDEDVEIENKVEVGSGEELEEQLQDFGESEIEPINELESDEKILDEVSSDNN